MNKFYGNLKIKRLSIENFKFDKMYALYFIPYLKWILLGLMILFYGFLFQSKRYKWLIAFHILLLILLCGQSTYFDIIDVTNFKGYYTPAVIDLLFAIIFLFLSVFLFREKIKIYKKIIVALTLALILLVSAYEYFILTIGGFKDPTEKTYVINNRFTLRKISLTMDAHIHIVLSKASTASLNKVGRQCIKLMQITSIH